MRRGAWLFLALLIGCGDDADTLELAFAARFGVEPARCGQSYEGIGTSSATVSLIDLRFYVSRLRLIAEDGAEAEVSLIPDGTFQSREVAMVDLEDGTGGCQAGTDLVHATVRGTHATGKYKGVAFDVGVPFELNHGDVTTAEPPLDNSAMFWNWNLGRKFFRVDLDVVGAERWNFHLGSTNCSPLPMPDPASPPTIACERPNLPEIRLPAFTKGASVVIVDLAQLLEDSNLSVNNDPMALGCASFPNEQADCTPVFPKLGMSFAEGGCVNGCAAQSVFSVE